MELPSAALSNGVGVVTVVVILGWMLAKGHLYTKRQYDDAIHDRDEWRAESRLKDAQIVEKDTQLRHLAEVGRVVHNIMAALQRSTEGQP